MLAPKLQNLKPGDPLPPYWSRDRREFVSQKVVGQQLNPTGLGILLKTTLGRYGLTDVFWFPDEEARVTFPRDPDPSAGRRNWATTDTIPTATELLVNDLIPKNYELDPRNDPGWDDADDLEKAETLTEYSADLWAERAYFVVLAIAPIPTQDVALAEGGMVLWLKDVKTSRRHRITVAHDSTPTEQMVVLATEPKLPRRPMVSADELELSGVYVHKPSGKEVQFAIHPTGRGRWPAGVAPYRRGGEGVMRPPSYKDVPRRSQGLGQPLREEWYTYELISGKPHPNYPTDPATGEAWREASRTSHTPREKPEPRAVLPLDPHGPYYNRATAKAAFFGAKDMVSFKIDTTGFAPYTPEGEGNMLPPSFLGPATDIEKLEWSLWTYEGAPGEEHPLDPQKSV